MISILYKKHFLLKKDERAVTMWYNNTIFEVSTNEKDNFDNWNRSFYLWVTRNDVYGTFYRPNRIPIISSGSHYLRDISR